MINDFMYRAVYLIDDFEVVNVLHRVLLGKLGLEDRTRAFTDPEKAFDELRSIVDDPGPILILLDINMPEMSGFEFLERMISESFPLCMDVVLVTSSISDNDKALAEQYPQFVRDFVTKPLKLETLERITARAYSR